MYKRQAPREKRLLAAIEKTTRKKIELMELPSTQIINDNRIAKFKQRITETLGNDDLTLYTQLIEQYQQEHNVPALEIGAALASLLQGDTPLLLKNKSGSKSADIKNERERSERSHTDERPRGKTNMSRTPPQEGLERFRVEVGHDHNVKPGNIVGAIANEAGLDSKYIGHIKIHQDHSFVDLPEGMPKEVFKDLKKVWVAGQQLNISRCHDATAQNSASQRKPARKRKKTHKARDTAAKSSTAKAASGKSLQRANTKKSAPIRTPSKRKKRSD